MIITFNIRYIGLARGGIRRDGIIIILFYYIYYDAKVKKKKTPDVQ